MLLQVNHVYKKFGGVEVLTDCHFEAERGKITALIGPNGAGKTTLFDIITGFLKADGGAILFDGLPITNEESFKIAKVGIARTFQQVRLWRHLTIFDHLYAAVCGHDDLLMHNVTPRRISEEAYERAAQVMRELYVEKPLDTPVSALSYGQRKLLCLAMAAHKPHRLLMLDEPVAGVNQKVREIIIAKIKEEVSGGGTVLLIEHDMHFISQIAEHVYVLDAGRVIASGTPAEIKNDKTVLEAYLGD